MNIKPRTSLVAGLLGASMLLATAGTAFAARPTSTPLNAPSPGPWNIMNATCADGEHRMSDRAMAALESNDTVQLLQALSVGRPIDPGAG